MIYLTTPFLLTCKEWVLFGPVEAIPSTRLPCVSKPLCFCKPLITSTVANRNYFNAVPGVVWWFSHIKALFSHWPTDILHCKHALLRLTVI